MEIREETVADLGDIRDLTRSAFSGAEHTDGTEHLVIEGLRAAGRLTHSLVFVDADESVGHIAVSPVEVVNGHGPGPVGWFGLGPLAVRPDRQREGIGAELMKAALGALRADGAAGAVLLGEPTYYSRFGFVHRPGLGMEGLPTDVSGYFQVLPLAAPVPEGIIRYDPRSSQSPDLGVPRPLRGRGAGCGTMGTARRRVRGTDARRRIRPERATSLHGAGTPEAAEHDSAPPRGGATNRRPGPCGGEGPLR